VSFICSRLAYQERLRPDTEDVSVSKKMFVAREHTKSFALQAVGYPSEYLRNKYQQCNREQEWDSPLIGFGMVINTEVLVLWELTQQSSWNVQ
jgi:hypothetical protein